MVSNPTRTSVRCLTQKNWVSITGSVDSSETGRVTGGMATEKREWSYATRYFAAQLPRRRLSRSTFPPIPAQCDFVRRACIRLQKLPHQGERFLIFPQRVRDAAIIRNHQLVVAHIGIVRRKKDT